MDSDFQNFMDTLGLSQGTKTQYNIYFDKIELLFQEGMLSQETINNFIATYKSNLVKSFLKLYLEYRNIKDIEIHRRTGRIPRKKPLLMPKEDVDKVLCGLYDYNEKFGLMAELSYLCALRREEVVNINAGDINWNEWMKDKQTGTLLIKGKGDKERYVIVPKELMLKLMSYVNKIQVLPSNKLFFKNESNKNKPISKERYWEVYHKIVVALFDKKYKLHTLRHTTATNWYDNGVDIIGIQNRLGHSDISTTRLYINPDNEKELEKWRSEE